MGGCGGRCSPGVGGGGGLAEGAGHPGNQPTWSRGPGCPGAHPPHTASCGQPASSAGTAGCCRTPSRQPLPQECAARGRTVPGVPGRAVGDTGLRRGAHRCLGTRSRATAPPGTSLRLIPQRWLRRVQRPLLWPRAEGRVDGQQRRRAPGALGARGLFKGSLRFLLGTGLGCVVMFTLSQ